MPSKTSASLINILLSLFPLTSPTFAYPTAGTTSLIPWSSTTDIHGNPNGIPFTFDTTPHARIQFSHTNDTLGDDWTPTGTWSFSVDTGTCGIVAHHARVNLHTSEEIDPVDGRPDIISNQGQQFFSSSNILYTGYWVPRYVTFPHARPGAVKTFQPVLAVKQKFTNCLHWEEGYGNGCPGATLQDESLWSGISTIGIGYGRKYDGQPQGTPDKNPLLNIEGIGGVALDSLTTFYPGWRIDEKGIQLGLTESIWNDPDREITELEIPTPGGIARPTPPESPGRNPHFEWDEVRGCVTFPPLSTGGVAKRALTCTPVALLLDTGMDWSSIRVGTAMAERVRDATTKRPKRNQIVDVFAVSPAVTQRVQLYKFTATGSVPLACYWTPAYTEVTSDPVYGRENFVNTGRRAFHVWGFAYDPWLGHVGFQLRTDTCAAALPGYPP